MSEPDEDITILIQKSKNPAAIDTRDRLYRLVASELRKLARSLRQGQTEDHTLQTTVLVNEAFLRLVNDPGKEWENRVKFYQIAHGAMRRILADHGRRRRPESLHPDAMPRQADPGVPAPEQAAEDRELMEGIGEALADLEARDPDAASAFMLCFFHSVQSASNLSPQQLIEAFNGERMTLEEAATVRNESVSTVHRKLGRALTFLQDKLQGY